MENNELQHHGTKGMKWGQRLYQNKDGSLTALGRARLGYKKRQAVKKRKATIKAKQKAKEKAAAEEKKTAETAKKTAEETAQKKEAVLKSRSAKELYDNAPLFDDDELNKAYQRLVLEKNIKGLVPEEVSKGKQFVSAIVSGAKTISDLTKSVNDIDKNFGNLLKRHADEHNKKSRQNASENKEAKKEKAKKEKESLADKVSKAGMKNDKKSDDGPLTGTVMGEGTSKGTWKPKEGPSFEGIFTDNTKLPSGVKRFVSDENLLASTVTDLVSGDTNLLSVGRQFLLEESRD